MTSVPTTFTVGTSPGGTVGPAWQTATLAPRRVGTTGAYNFPHPPVGAKNYSPTYEVTGLRLPVHPWSRLPTSPPRMETTLQTGGFKSTPSASGGRGSWCKPTFLATRAEQLSPPPPPPYPARNGESGRCLAAHVRKASCTWPTAG